MNKYSNYKIAWFPEKLRSLKTGNTTAPIYVRIKPTNQCNHDCMTCIYEPEYVGMHSTMSRKDKLSQDKLMEVVGDLVSIGTKAITWSGGGEPLLHPNIIEVFKKAREGGINQAIITNGQKLLPDKQEQLQDFDWVRISFDYYDSKSFTKIRRVKGEGFDTVLKNASEFAKVKNSNCDFGANFIVSKDNYKRLFEMASRLKDIGFENIRFSPLWIRNFSNYHKEIEINVLRQIDKCRILLADSYFQVYDSYNIDFQGQSSNCKKCYIMQIVPVIAADYNVYACHNKAFDNKGLIGSIKDKSFKELWFSQETQDIFANFNPILSCQGHQCSSNQRNILITDIMDADGINFI